tara:strand:- start:3242 stop:4018 length:777 start_codon:yes stop_codon:yes gene_type:complete
MKVVILAGGFGTRLGDLTEILPKPMIDIGKMPILWHIMKIYSSYGFDEFVIALGYKAFEIKKYFSNFLLNTSNCNIDLSSGEIKYFKREDYDWKITLVDTGLNTMTGGRIKRLREFLGDEPFMLTYGDGVSDVNISELYDFHKSKNKILTVTAVRPIARFGELIIENNIVKNFYEKPQISHGWINGGFFVCQPEVFNFLDNDQTVFEKEPMETLSKINELAAFEHNGFWHCMDTKRDKIILENLWNLNKASWTNNWKN